MSMHFNVQDDLSLARRQAGGRLFGSCIEKTRQAGGRSVEEAAHLAGMEASQWAAIEGGYVPADSTQLRSMAGALECGYEKIATLAFICLGPGNSNPVLPLPQTFRSTAAGNHTSYTHLQREEVRSIKT